MGTGIFSHPRVTHQVPEINGVSIVSIAGSAHIPPQVLEIKGVSILSLAGSAHIPPQSAVQHIKKEYFWKVLEIGFVLMIVSDSDFN
jgi:hypothetical protein